MKNLLFKSAYVMAKASDGNPVVTTATVFLFYIFFNALEAVIETLLFGERFEHWLDPVFIGGFIAYSAYAVWACAVYNSNNSEKG